jgi:hypothetical protein
MMRGRKTMQEVQNIVVQKKKHVTLFQLIWLYKMKGKIFCQFQKHSNYSSVQKWWKKPALQHLTKQKLFSVARQPGKLKDVTPNELYAFI